MPGYSQPKERDGHTAFYGAGQEATQQLLKSPPALPTAVYRQAYLEADSGSSGSGVVGEDGSVKGVLTQGEEVQLEDGRIVTVSSFIDIQYILRDLQTRWSVTVPSCDSRASER